MLNGGYLLISITMQHLRGNVDSPPLRNQYRVVLINTITENPLLRTISLRVDDTRGIQTQTRTVFFINIASR
jgi:hypothetical protein